MWRIVFAQLRLNGWNRGVGDVTTGMIPYIVQAPRFFAGQIKVGDLLQTVAAFGNVCGAMSFFRDSYDEFTVYRAALLRIDQMLDSDHRARELPRIAVTDADAALTLTDVGVRNLQGQDMITDLNLALTPGGSVVVKGPSGCGKTTLLRSLAQLWPQTSGLVARPDGWATLFLPQLPYLPLGNLRETVVYPLPVEEVSDEELKQALRDVSLGHLTERLDQEADWAAVLSLGSSSGSPSCGCCWCGPQWCSWMSPPRPWTKGLRTRCTRWCANGCPPAWWSVWATARPSTATISRGWSSPEPEAGNSSRFPADTGARMLRELLATPVRLI